MSTVSKHASLEYEHTQKAPLAFMLFAITAAMWIGAWATPLWPVRGLLLLVSVLFVFLGFSFRQLTVREDGASLQIAFGPLPVFSRRVAYSTMEQVSPGRTSVIEGWGIHISPQGGWVWNIWGRDCVDVIYGNGKRVRIGTDDVAGLVQHLHAKMDACQDE